MKMEYVWLYFLRKREENTLFEIYEVELKNKIRILKNNNSQD